MVKNEKFMNIFQIWIYLENGSNYNYFNEYIWFEYYYVIFEFSI